MKVKRVNIRWNPSTRKRRRTVDKRGNASGDPGVLHLNCEGFKAESFTGRKGR